MSGCIRSEFAVATLGWLVLAAPAGLGAAARAADGAPASGGGQPGQSDLSNVVTARVK